MKILLFLSLFLFSSLSFGMSTKERIELIKDLKDFILNFEKQNQLHQLTQAKSYSLFELIQSAYADSPYSCFYGGWPSEIKIFNGKKYCTNPKTSGAYSQGMCKTGELACQPLLFGRELCVGFTSQFDKLNAFNNCEKKFQTERKGDYKFVEKIQGDELNQLDQYLRLVSDLCNVNNENLKVITENCNKINAKIKLHYQNKKPSNTDKVNAQNCVDCQNNQNGGSTGNLEELNKDLKQVAAITDLPPSPNEMDPIQVLYQKLEQDYKSSELCDPVNNYQGQQRQVLTLKALNQMTESLNPYFDQDYNPEKQKAVMAQLAEKLEWSMEENLFFSNLYKELNETDYAFNFPNVQERYRRRELYFAKAKLLIAHIKKNALEKLELKPQLANTLLHPLLAEKNVIKLDEEGKLDCPFVDYEVFTKAYTGYNKLNSQGKIKNNKLTIVDYTKPSNSRRMFTIDMQKKMVLGNTWVAHGSGTEGSQTAGSDGLGSSPMMSNTNESNLSSDGFILTSAASTGNLYGKNILLNGIDLNNKNIMKRAIILHGFPVQPLTSNQDEEEIIQKILDTKNFDPNDPGSINRAAYSMADFNMSDFIPSTWGCLGVTNQLAPDRVNGGYTSQLDQLRRDIAGGSLIFSYSGPEQKSLYF